MNILSFSGASAAAPISTTPSSTREVDITAKLDNPLAPMAHVDVLNMPKPTAVAYLHMQLSIQELATIWMELAKCVKIQDETTYKANRAHYQGLMEQWRTDTQEKRELFHTLEARGNTGDRLLLCMTERERGAFRDFLKRIRAARAKGDVTRLDAPSATEAQSREQIALLKEGLALIEALRD